MELKCYPQMHALTYVELLILNIWESCHNCHKRFVNIVIYEQHMLLC